ncbi:MAG: glycine cleavage system aminomethyltransferase GcvT [Pseudomonadota bacterium]
MSSTAVNTDTEGSETVAGNSELKRTPLHAWHLALGAKMTPFAGYDMPIQYADGVLKEHLHTRAAAGLFDVSHMGQAWLHLKDKSVSGDAAHRTIAAALETVSPGEFQKLKPGSLRYSVLLNDEGGIVDDFMTTRPPDAAHAGLLFLVLNAACKERDFTLLKNAIGHLADLEIADDRALLAIQGPKAAEIVDRLFPGAGAQKFMSMSYGAFRGQSVYISRCGYTGEDGFELSIINSYAEELAEKLLAEGDVAPIGLGARDSLRLEAGLCLYGHDLDETTSPVEGNIAFAIGKRRKVEGGFPGASRIQRELEKRPSRLRVGIKPAGRAPARDGAKVVDNDGAEIGVITSGGFAPSLNAPIAMGYIDATKSAVGTKVGLLVRNRTLDAEIVPLPFITPNYFRG